MVVLKGIGEAIGSMFGVEPKTVDENLEDKINKALAAEREKIRPSKEDILWLSWVTKDNNPIHRLPKRAKKMGFDDIPLMGSHMAAYGEQYIEGVVNHLREYWGADIKIIGQENKFKAPLHPEERVLWQVTGYKPANDKIKLEATGSVKDKKVIDITSTLCNEYPKMPQIAGPIFSNTYLLEDEHLEAFHNSVGGKDGKNVPHMLPASYVPATLLTLLERETQTMEGSNLAMKFDFLNEANPGSLQVDIFPPRRPSERKGQYIYKFRTVVSQETLPITYGEITSAIPMKVEF
jgi:hypothetical protein